MPNPKITDLSPITMTLDAVEHLLNLNSEHGWQLLTEREFSYLNGLRWGLWMAQGNPKQSPTFNSICDRLAVLRAKEEAS